MSLSVAPLGMSWVSPYLRMSSGAVAMLTEPLQEKGQDMRATAFENLLKLMIEAHEQDNKQAMDNYCAKAKILISRSNDASVIRELVNFKG